jgi:hypothetical protein
MRRVCQSPASRSACSLAELRFAGSVRSRACRRSAKQRQPCASRRAVRPASCGGSAEPVPSDLGVAGRQPAARSAARDRIVTCRAMPSSVAWASLAPSSRSGQTASDASYWPRRTPSRLACSQAHPTELAPPCAAGRLRLGHGLRRGRPRRLAGDRWARPARGTGADRAAGHLLIAAPEKCGNGKSKSPA